MSLSIQRGLYDPCAQDPEKDAEKVMKNILKSHISGPIKTDETYEYRFLESHKKYKCILYSLQKRFNRVGYKESSCRNTNVKKMNSEMKEYNSHHCLYMFKCRKYQDGPLMVKIGRTSNSDSRFSTYRKDGVEIIGNIHYWMIL